MQQDSNPELYEKMSKIVKDLSSNDAVPLGTVVLVLKKYLENIEEAIEQKN